MKKCLLFSISFLLSLALCGQKVSKWIDIGKELEAQGKYYEACEMYEHGSKISQDNADLNYTYAECLSLLNNYEEAETYYALTIQTDEQGLYPDAVVKLANLQKSNGHYEESMRTWEAVKEKYASEPQSPYYRKAIQELAALQLILRNKIPEYDPELYNLGSVNTLHAEFGSSFYDSTSIVYSWLPQNTKTGENEFISLYTGLKDRTFWRKGPSLPAHINLPGYHNANGSFSSGKNYFVFTRCEDSNNGCLIYVSRFSRGNFTEPVAVNVNLQGYSSTQPTLVEKGNKLILFFTSNRPGGAGGYDIWYAAGDTSLAFGNPVNVTAVNSPEDELSPFYFPKNGFLYFSSTWHTGLGGHDIFQSFSPDLTSFGAPENIGKPFNSQANDFYFVLDHDGRYGMLTSNRIGSKSSFGKTCCNDLYGFTYPGNLVVNQPDTAEADKQAAEDITPKPHPDVILPEKVNESEALFNKLTALLPITLYFHNDEPDPRSVRQYTPVTYGEAYTSYLSVKPDYEKENPHYADSWYNGYVHYGYNKLNRFLNLLVLLLEKNVSVELSIQGYASPLAADNYNVNLTSRRISSLRNEIRYYRNGIFVPYLESDGKKPLLKITELPYGESKSKPGVSDDINRKKLSVYSVEAALERKVEVVALDMQPFYVPVEEEIVISKPPAQEEIAEATEDPPIVNEETPEETPEEDPAGEVPEMVTETGSGDEEEAPAVEPTADGEVPPPGEEIYLSAHITLDLGKVKRGSIISRPVKFRNTYGRDLTFAKVKEDCNCTGLKVPDMTIVPDEVTTFTLMYDTKSKSFGQHEGEVTITTKELSEPIRIRFTAEVIP